MRVERTEKRTVAFFDGQNLFHAAREAFGYTWPNYDVAKLAHALVSMQGHRVDILWPTRCEKVHTNCQEPNK